MAVVSESEKMNQPILTLCSVCIANYNGENFIEQCIDSVLMQEDFPGVIEIIVHDDASTDNSVSLVKQRYPQVRLIVSETNIGFCKSNNKMVANSRGKYILLLNNDAILQPTALKSLYTASLKYGEGIFGLPQYDAETGELIDVGSIFDPFLNPVPNKNFARKDVGMVIGACLWISKNLWEILGGFPDWFESLAEDMYLCCLARLNGFPVKMVTSSWFSHWVGRSFGGGKVVNHKLSTNLSRRSSSERNKTFVMLICYPSAAAWLIIPFHILLLVLEGVVLSTIKKDKRIWSEVYLSCLTQVYKKRKLWIQHRSLAQQNRRNKISCFFSTFTFIPHKLKMFLIHGLPEVR